MMSSTLEAMASNLEAMASHPEAIAASNLVVQQYYINFQLLSSLHCQPQDEDIFQKNRMQFHVVVWR